MERRDLPDLGGHYAALAAEYEDHWVYGPSHVPWMAARIIEALSLSPSDRIADIGCGTGLFSREVARIVQSEHPVLCVDPSAEMLRKLGAPPPSGLSALLATAEDVAEGRAALPCEELDAVWLKESVHHLHDSAKTLRGLARRLAPGGRLLVAMLPCTIEYPLFRAALERFEELQPDPARIARELEAAALQTQLFHVEHELRLDKEKFLGMVRARYMSLLSAFSEAEIEKGVAEISAAHPESVLVFPDRFAFVRGVKPGGAR